MLRVVTNDEIFSIKNIELENEFQQCYLHGLNCRMKCPVKNLKALRIPGNQILISIFILEIYLYVYVKRKIWRDWKTFWLNAEWFSDDKNQVERSRQVEVGQYWKEYAGWQQHFIGAGKPTPREAELKMIKGNRRFFTLTPERGLPLNFICYHRNR